MEKSTPAGDEKIRTLRDRTATYLKSQGRRPRILITRIPTNGSERTGKSVAAALADIGFDVDVNLSVLPPAAVARIALENDVHAIGIPCVSSVSEPFVTELLASLNGEWSQRILVVVWLSASANDISTTLTPGTGNLRIFGPQTDYNDSAIQILDALA